MPKMPKKDKFPVRAVAMENFSVESGPGRIDSDEKRPK